MRSAVQLWRMTSDGSVISRDARGKVEPILGLAEPGAKPVSQTGRETSSAPHRTVIPPPVYAVAGSERTSPHLNTM